MKLLIIVTLLTLSFNIAASEWKSIVDMAYKSKEKIIKPKSRYSHLTSEQLQERYKKAKTLKVNRADSWKNYSISQNNYRKPPKVFHKKRIYSDVKCPCNGGNNCFGPRGGRYCITSGNNKRYR